MTNMSENEIMTLYYYNDDNGQLNNTKNVTIESNEIEIERNCEITNEQITEDVFSVNENSSQFKTITCLLDLINEENMIFQNNNDNQSCYTKDVTEDNCSINNKDDIQFDTIYSLLDFINKENAIFQNEDHNNQSFHAEDYSVINKSNKITLESFNICSENNLEIKTNDYYKNKCVQNSIFEKEEITNNLHSDNHNNESYHSKELINNSDKNDSKKKSINSTSEKPFDWKLYVKRFKKAFSQDDCLSNIFTAENIICNFCNKSFNKSKNFKQHMEIHSEIKKFACTICHKMFTQRGNCKRHMAIHTKIKPHSCDICKQPFARKYDLKRHVKYCLNNLKKKHNL